MFTRPTIELGISSRHSRRSADELRCAAIATFKVLTSHSVFRLHRRTRASHDRLDLLRRLAVLLQAQRLVQTAARKDLHPELHKAKVICNGEEVLELTGTSKEYHVEVWSGNHPFYKGDTSALVVDEGQVRTTQLYNQTDLAVG